MRVKTYQYLHKPFRLLWIESDELFIIFLGLILGIYVYTPFFFFAMFTAFIIRKVKSKFPRGFIRHMSYFLGLYRFKHYPTFFDAHFKE